VATLRTFDDFNSLVQQCQGIVTIQMWVLRDLHGAGRTGQIVREKISKKLKDRGLRHYPEDLPNDQNAYVTVYAPGTSAAELIHAVLEPTLGSDDLVRRAIANANEGTEAREAQETLQMIKELVCEI